MPSVTLPSDFATACASAASGVCPPNGDGVQATVAYFADPTLLVEARRTACMHTPGPALALWRSHKRLPTTGYPMLTWSGGGVPALAPGDRARGCPPPAHRC